MFFLSILFLCFFIFIVCMGGPFNSFTLLYNKYVIPHFSNLLGVNKLRPVTAFIAPILFFGLFSLLVSGFLPYAIPVMTSLKFVFWFCLSCYLMSFFYLTSTEKLSLIMVKRGYPFYFHMFMVPVEVMSEFIKPFSLCVRLYANIMFGHYLLEGSYFLVWYLGPLFYWVSGFLFVFELCVFFVQSYIFSYLVCLYFSE